MEKLSELENGLAKEVEIEKGTESQAYEFLMCGTKLVKAKSRFIETHTTVTYEPGT